ncbi:hypothetical protein [Planktothrix agardhii]|uniref:hypothetical protein n=1 Tax=Planktothrix agardhii TaxID=1160 RepID=UPI0009076D2F|nr:hypothetical protein [Planktothrix agardhii]
MSAVRVRLPPLKIFLEQISTTAFCEERVNAGKSSSQNLENCIEESKGINNETRTRESETREKFWCSGVRKRTENL